MEGASTPKSCHSETLYKQSIRLFKNDKATYN